MSVFAIIFFSITGVLLVIVGTSTKRRSNKILVKERKPNALEKLQASDWYIDLENEMIEKEKEDNEKSKLLNKEK